MEVPHGVALTTGRPPEFCGNPLPRLGGLLLARCALQHFHLLLENDFDALLDYWEVFKAFVLRELVNTLTYDAVPLLVLNHKLRQMVGLAIGFRDLRTISYQFGEPRRRENRGSVALPPEVTIVISTFVLLLLALPAAAAMNPQSWSEFSGRGYTARIPSELKAEKTYNADFELATFSRSNGELVLSIYAGLHPNFGSEAPKSAAYKKGSIHGKPTQWLTWTTPAGESCAEVLVTLRSSSGFTLSAHSSYCVKSEADRILVDAIINSVQLESSK
jgi:hypothetical protein